MLQNLTISNYALIDRLEFEPADGLSIITGETGAGKSIMLGAVGLLLGNRADTKTLLDTNKKCIIEGEFEIGEYNLRSFFEELELDYEDTAIIRREISTSGKSRGFVNDTPVNLEIMRTLGNHLMDIHSQNDTQQLGSPIFQLNIVDAFADTLDLFSGFKSRFTDYEKANSRYDKLVNEESRIRKEADFNSFLVEELEKASFVQGEQDKLEEEQEILSNAEEIKTLIQQAFLLLVSEDYSVTSGIENLVQIFRQLTKFSGHYSNMQQRIESVLIEVNDIRRELETEDEKVEFDPARISEIQDRLSMLYHLLQKHQAGDINELLEIHQDLKAEMDKFNNLDEELALARRELEKKKEEAMKIALELSSRRKDCFEDLCSNLTKMLKDLGMPDVTLKVQHLKTEISSNGVDEISILFSANKGIKPQPLRNVASGGEFSRLMFCIKYLLARKTSLPTLIFDEIDSGVSGEIALQMGNMMKEMAARHQVISISHLPQMAAKAHKHFFVFKDLESNKAVSRIRQLSESERVEEIAKMIAGDNPTHSAFVSAKELIESK